MLSVSNDGTERPYYAWRDVSEGHVMMPFPDFGDVQDNGTARHIAMHEIRHGDVAWGCAVLVQLREYICTTQEVQSLQWVLPQVDAALQHFGACNSTPHEFADSY